LASDVELLLLDEPTSGLDPLMEAMFRSCIREERDRGRTVLLSSHILSEAEALSDRVSIIRNGRVVDTGSLADLRQLTRTSITAQLQHPPHGVADLVGVHNAVITGGQLTCEVEPAGLSALLLALTRFDVVSLICQPPTLEELFLRHYTTADAP
jgi:ABC-2 type transport system ATP-binding protein